MLPDPFLPPYSCRKRCLLKTFSASHVYTPSSFHTPQPSPTATLQNVTQRICKQEHFYRFFILTRSSGFLLMTITAAPWKWTKKYWINKGRQYISQYVKKLHMIVGFSEFKMLLLLLLCYWRLNHLPQTNTAKLPKLKILFLRTMLFQNTILPHLILIHYYTKPKYYLQSDIWQEKRTLKKKKKSFLLMKCVILLKLNKTHRVFSPYQSVKHLHWKKTSLDCRFTLLASCTKDIPSKNLPGGWPAPSGVMVPNFTARG